MTAGVLHHTCNSNSLDSKSPNDISQSRGVPRSLHIGPVPYRICRLYGDLANTEKNHVTIVDIPVLASIGCILVRSIYRQKISIEITVLARLLIDMALNGR